jgi:hypothetical protein
MAAVVLLALFGAWCAVEIAFYAAVALHVSPRMSAPTQPPEFCNAVEDTILAALDAVDWLSENGQQYSVEEFLSRWFGGADFQSIHRLEALEFFSWTCFSSHLADLSERDAGRVETMVHAFEQRYEHTFPAGSNPKCSSLRHTLEPVPYMHRPLTVYGILGAARQVAALWMRCKGFRRHTTACGLRYWHRAPTATISQQQHQQQQSKLPIVLFHGLGFGLPVYWMVIQQICMDREAVVVETPSISMTLHLMRGTKKVPNEEEYGAAIRAALNKHSITKALFVGHR